jgi:3-oxoadipate enol-lactonase
MPFTRVGNRQVYYEQYDCAAGNDGEPPLVLITGLSGSCRGWQPLQVPEFVATRSVLIFDNRGTGQSEDPGDSFTTADLAADTAGLLDALEIERADVLGASMGGMIAQEIALAAPERIRKLVLVGTYARPDAKRQMLLEDWAAQARRTNSLGDMLRQRLLWTLQDETLEQRDLIDSMVEFFEKEENPTTPDLFARQCDACVAHDTADRLREISQPTLVVCGRNDQFTPPSFHRELADEIPNAHLVTLSYGGHLVMAESAERFNQIVLQFLDS